MFFFKKEKIHLDCFTRIGAIAKDAPIEKTSNFLPEWWKKMPPIVPEHVTYGVSRTPTSMKHCSGFIELYKQGVVVPLWSDLKIKVIGEKFYYDFAIDEGSITSHLREQHGNQFSKSLNLKIINPWLFRESTGVKFLLMECFWNIHEKFPKFRMLPGVLDFKYQYGVHINCFVECTGEAYEYEFELGTPLIQIIPLSEKNVVPHIHIVDDVEYRKIEKDTTKNRFSKFFLRRVKGDAEIKKRNGRSFY